MPCPTHGSNIPSERSAAHDCIDGRGRHLEYGCGQTLPALPGYMCIAHVCLPRGAEWAWRQRWAVQQRAFSRMLPPFLFLSFTLRGLMTAFAQEPVLAPRCVRQMHRVREQALYDQ